jgi:hypothetical protein
VRAEKTTKKKRLIKRKKRADKKDNFCQESVFLDLKKKFNFVYFNKKTKNERDNSQSYW